MGWVRLPRHFKESLAWLRERIRDDQRDGRSARAHQGGRRVQPRDHTDVNLKNPASGLGAREIMDDSFVLCFNAHHETMSFTLHIKRLRCAMATRD